MQLITIFLVSVILFGIISACPDICFCKTYTFGIYVYCHHFGLGSIPTNLPVKTYYLSLNNNQISVIENNAFMNPTSLSYLYLDDCEITVITYGNFVNTPRLISISLENNKISVIENDAFVNLTSLLYLHLRNNKISVIQQDAFRYLISLTLLDLGNNNVSVIEQDAFRFLTSLPYGSLYLELHCDCNNIWLLEWSPYRGSSSITCIDDNYSYLQEICCTQGCMNGSTCYKDSDGKQCSCLGGVDWAGMLCRGSNEGTVRTGAIFTSSGSEDTMGSNEGTVKPGVIFTSSGSEDTMGSKYGQDGPGVIFTPSGSEDTLSNGGCCSLGVVGGLLVSCGTLTVLGLLIPLIARTQFALCKRQKSEMFIYAVSNQSQRTV